MALHVIAHDGCLGLQVFNTVTVRSQVFTVANVGDSICVLSVAGKAVQLLPMHRLSDPAERRAVESAGGRVLNNRYIYSVVQYQNKYSSLRYLYLE